MVFVLFVCLLNLKKLNLKIYLGVGFAFLSRPCPLIRAEIYVDQIDLQIFRHFFEEFICCWDGSAKTFLYYSFQFRTLLRNLDL